MLTILVFKSRLIKTGQVHNVVQGILEAHLHANTPSVYLGVQSPPGA